jgi:hypothetical protein
MTTASPCCHHHQHNHHLIASDEVMVAANAHRRSVGLLSSVVFVCLTGDVDAGL